MGGTGDVRWLDVDVEVIFGDENSDGKSGARQLAACQAVTDDLSILADCQS